MNFDTYLDTHKPNHKRTAMLTLAGALAVTGTTLLLSAGWIAGKLQVARVDPPTVEYVLLSLSVDEPMPPPPPPPPPPGSDDPDDQEPEDTDPDEIPDEPDPLEEPDEMPTSIPKAKQPAGHPAGQVGGIPGGKPGGIPGGNPSSTLIPKGPAIAMVPTKEAPAIKKPLSSVMASAVYSPEPDQRLLATTKAARYDKRNGRNTTAFCISTSGRVEKVRTKSKFPGDPQVDKIIRDTIKKWRFRPLQVGGKPAKVCTERTFLIKFQ